MWVEIISISGKRKIVGISYGVTLFVLPAPFSGTLRLNLIGHHALS
jgi:hypothetical protein